MMVISPQKSTRLGRRGVTVVLVVVLLPVLFILAAFAINIAHIESVNTEVQIATDAAVRSAGRAYAITGDGDAALAAAREAAARNPIGDFVLPINASDLSFGFSTRRRANQRYNFRLASEGEGNAVRVVTRTLNSSQRGIEPLFPFFGPDFSIRPRRSSISTQGAIDVALVVDRSGSMAYAADEVAQFPPAPAAAPAGWQFGDPVPPRARWLDLIAAVRVFGEELNRSPQSELVALSSYNEEGFTNQRLTRNFSLINRQLRNISTQFNAGGTSIGQGMLEGLAAVSDTSRSREFASKVMVLMTDGVHNTGRMPGQVSRRLAREGVTLFTVTFSDEADQAMMARIAERTGGQHFHAVTAQQLSDAFEDIARYLPSLITR